MNTYTAQQMMDAIQAASLTGFMVGVILCYCVKNWNSRRA